MKHVKQCVTAIAAMVTVTSAHAQVQNLNGDHRLAPGTGIPRTFTIGNTYGAGGPALNVRGDLLGAGWTTGEVFRTVAPAANNTYWRMYSGGVAAGNERGQLFSETGQQWLSLNAPNGHLRLMTGTLQRMRLNPTVTYLTLGNFTNVNADGYVLISPNSNFTNNTWGPYSRLHLAEGVLGQNTQQSGFRPWQRNGITFTGNNDQMFIGA